MGTTGVCAQATGAVECNGTGGAMCSVNPGGSMSAATAETCDGADNNCNGSSDEGFNVGSSCMGTTGVCAQATGAVECNGTGGAMCSVNPGGSMSAATAETCDGADNNCNGSSDEGFNVGSSCMGTTGVCAQATGAVECNGTGGAMCSVNPGGSMSAATAETCDGADNNCNGSSDEGFNVGSSCMGTTGVCAQATGAVECNGSGGAMCSVNPGGSMSAATAETCDGADNNCNGSSDEGFNVGTSCMGTTGICALATGAVECDGMGAAMCSVDPGGSTSATLPEDCDGADNNCNGSTDEGILCECLADADCADGNSCTVNTCESDACVDTSVPAGDLGECTMGAVCSGDPTNACVTCADTDPTNTDSGCAMETPHCRVVAMGATCEICADLGPGTDVGCETATPNCVVGDSGASECVSCISDSDCDDGNECTTEVCSAGACTNPSLTEFSPCSGGVCTAAAMCTAVTVVIEGPPDGDVLANATPTISGTGTPGATIDVIIDGTSVGTTIVDALGQWTLPLTTPLDDGPHAVIAETTVGGMDAMDNSGFSVDTMTVVAIVDPADGSTTLDSSPLLRGTGEPGAEVVVSIDGVEVGRVTVAVDGTWFIGNIDALLNGPHTMTAVATDLVGNTATATSAFTVDSDTAVDINGPASGALLNNNMPTITGTAVPGAQVVISIEVGGTPTTLGTVTADASGNWTLPLTSPLADGPYVVTALATDPIGNMASDSSVFSIDTVTLVTVDDIDPGTGVISGTGEPGAEIRITVDGNEVGVVTVGSDGTWSFDGDSLGVGTHVVDVTATDPAGNTATDTSSITVPMMDGGVGPDSGTSGTFGGVSGGALCSTGAPAGEGWPAALGLLLVGAALAHRRRR
jgi:MYXO-CTERM domain-containing protein